MKPSFIGSTSATSSMELLTRFAALVERDRATTVQLLRCLDEIDQRQLWAAEGHGSLFAFCVQRFHMSEALSAKRIRAARTARRFPVVLEMLERGDVHLSAISMLASHLTPENHLDVLSRAKHRTKRELEVLVAEVAPQQEARSCIVAAPTATTVQRAAESRTARLLAPTTEKTESLSSAPGTVVPTDTPSPSNALGTALPSPSPQPRPVTPTPPASTEPPPSTLTPTAPSRYRLHVTIDQDAHDNLRKLQALLSHSVPDGDPATIVARALEALLEKAVRERAAETQQPRTTPTDAATPKGRTIPRAVIREVWRRDGGQCAFVSARGKRCDGTHFLELHHVVAFARGGASTVENLALRCRGHNQYEATLDYGDAFMRGKRGGCNDAGRVREEVVGYRATIDGGGGAYTRRSCWGAWRGSGSSLPSAGPARLASGRLAVVLGGLVDGRGDSGDEELLVWGEGADGLPPAKWTG